MNKRFAQYNFEGKTAVITGAAKGIGASIGSHLRAQGATIISWDLVTSPDSPFLQAKVDVTSPQDIEAAIEHAIRSTGQIDLLINNAGFSGPAVPLDEAKPSDWHRIVEVNLIGVFNVCHAVVPHMRRAKQGRIINMASLAGKEGTPKASAYSAAKAGVIALTKSLGRELASSGILVNAIAAAAIETELLKQMTPEHVQTLISKGPMGRLGDPSEVAELVCWLASDSCSFSTGAIFDLSGGRAVY